MAQILPTIQTPVLDVSGTMSRPFYKYLQSVALSDTTSAIQAALTALTEQVDAIPGGFSIRTQQSVAQQGAAIPGGVIIISLQNDATTPSDTSFYGTDDKGERGWQPMLGAFTSSPNIVPSAGGNGVVSFDLTDVTLTTGGLLEAYAFDTYGRLSKSQAITWATAGTIALTYTSGSNTVSASLNNTTVVPATYGSATQVGIFTVNATGQITGASNVTVTPAFSSITGKPTTLAGYGITDGVTNTTTVTGGPGLAGGGALSSNITLSLAMQAASTLLGNPLATTGTPSAITIGSGLTLTTGGVLSATGGGSGTVTSVALTAPAIFSVSGSPITTSGTLAITLATQASNVVWAGPASGSAAVPTFRALVAADIPNLPSTKITGLAAVATAGTFASLTAIPTTIAGYGITNAVVNTTAINAGIGLAGGGTLSSSVTLSLATQAASTLLGNPSTGTAVPTPITVGTGLNLSTGGVLTATNTSSGTVTSVALTAPSIISVAGSPITGAGTLALSLATQGANTFFAGPSGGANAVPTFRSQVLADIGPALPPGYIDGFAMSWNSTTSISVSSGSCYIPNGTFLASSSVLTLSGLSLTASTMYHVYAYNNAGTPAIECVTTSPAAAYNGTGRAKTGDTSRRYVGSILTNTSGGVIQFYQNGNSISYLNISNGTATNRALSNGMSTARTSVSLSPFIPITANQAYLHIQNTSTMSGTCVFDIPESGNTGLNGLYALSISQSLGITSPCPSQTITYVFNGTPTTSGAYVDVLGYYFQR